MTVKELKAKAKSLGLRGYSNLRKASLERLIADAEKILEDERREAPLVKELLRQKKASVIFIKGSSCICRDCGSDDITIDLVSARNEVWCTECGLSDPRDKTGFDHRVKALAQAVELAMVSLALPRGNAWREGNFTSVFRAVKLVLSYNVRKSRTT